MDNQFFEKPILNSPYDEPIRHWELDDQGQPTQRIIETRRRAQFISPIPKLRKRKGKADQQQIVFDEGEGLSTEKQQYDQTSIINELRHHVDQWRCWPNPNEWQVTPETTRLLQHWRTHRFSGIRPFFCQIEAVETAIWLTEVAPKTKTGKAFLEHLANANHDANPELVERGAAGRITLRQAQPPTVILPLLGLLAAEMVRCTGGNADVEPGARWDGRVQSAGDVVRRCARRRGWWERAERSGRNRQ
jgi:hypothetical protein